MARIFTFLLAALLLITPAQAQIINNGTAVIGGTTGQCVTQGSNGLALMAPCTTGGLPLSGGTMTGTLALKGYNETVVAATITSNVLTIDTSLGSVFTVTNNANITTFTVTNCASARATNFTIYFTGNGSAFTQAGLAASSTMKWANGGVAPAFTTTNGKVDIVTFASPDGCTTLYGMVGGQNF